MTTEIVTLETPDLESLKLAHRLLQNPGWIARVSNIIGQPLESGLKKLPKNVSDTISDAVEKAIHAALKVAIKTMDTEDATVKANPPKASNWWHKAAAAASGAAGGAFGLAAIAVELPISTTIMMRSIADIARSEGEDLSDHEAQVQCVMVLAFGGRSEADDGSEVGYFAVRQAMAAAVTDAATYLAKGSADTTAPVIVQLIRQIAQRFGIQVSEKAAAQLVPIIGAVSGAAINTLFIDHFQDMSRGHFTVRRLEKKYGVKVIKQKYERLTELATIADAKPSLLGVSA
jgi:hypothetical protein